MNIQPSANLADARIPLVDQTAVALRQRESFAQVLAQGSVGAAAAEENTRAQRAYQAAQEVVAANFIQPILDQLKNDPFRSELFHGGQGEEIFQQQLNVELAKRITVSARLPVVDAVYRSIMKSSARNSGEMSRQA